ncbi:MAG: diphthine--ammonia ligase [Deltaproteobacteria bacterium]|nr:diphthine--ammonia ligase [Deltaproteobacteria bacterium]
MRKKALMSWSSGKDSAWALYELQQKWNMEIDLVGLFCTVNKEFDRVAMHGVRVELLRKQAKSIGLPLKIIEIPYPCSNAEYEKIMRQFVKRAKKDNIEYVAFGDLFLQNVRNYREEKLKDSGIKPIFPIWGMPTDKLSREMIKGGLKTVITCIDSKQIPTKFIGKEFDENFLDSLPDITDHCGENGEFHSFVFDGPMFKEQIEIVLGDIIHRDDFVFADILLKRR